MTVSVDPSSVPLLRDVGTERFLKSTRGADLCFPNLEEGVASRGRRARAHRGGSSSHYSGVVLKLGAEGALYADTDGGWERVPAAPARVVDTTGAGDALCAGFLSAGLFGASPSEALRRGVGLATEAVRRGWVPALASDGRWTRSTADGGRWWQRPVLASRLQVGPANRSDAGPINCSLGRVDPPS